MLLKHSKLENYLSTPSFIKQLTDISYELIHQPNQAAFLSAELKKVNEQLPGAVYIPFVSQSMRNYAVLHIAAYESRIFRTKERAPIMLCVEVYRPFEISLEKVPVISEETDDGISFEDSRDALLERTSGKKKHSQSFNYSSNMRDSVDTSIYPFDNNSESS